MKDLELINFMLEKSIDSFLMGIEVYNKPTKKFKLEGLLFYLCNAWELMLKAKILKDDNSIYYKDNISRTITLSDCVRRVMTNDKDPVRINMDAIIILRNTATHFIIPEYENNFLHFVVYNVQAFADKMLKYHDINVDEYFSSDFISMFVPNSKSKNVNKLQAKYSKDICNVLKEKVDLLENIRSRSDNPIAAVIEVAYKKVPKSAKPDVTYSFASDSNTAAIEIEKVVDINMKYNLTRNQIIERVNDNIKKGKIPYKPVSDSTGKPFTSHAFNLIVTANNFKKDIQCCYTVINGKHNTHKYSENLVDNIMVIITDDPECVLKLNNLRREEVQNKKN